MMKALIDQAFAALIADMPNVHNETFAPLHQAIYRNKAMLDDLADKQAEIKASPRLSTQGQMSDLRDYAKSKGYDEALRDRFKSVRAARAAANARSAALGVKRPDPSDIVGEMQRAESRAIMRSLDDLQRVTAALSNETLLNAALTAPAVLSGLRPEERQALLDQYNNQYNAAALADIAQYNNAIDVAEAAVTITNNELMSVFGYDLLAQFITASATDAYTPAATFPTAA